MAQEESSVKKFLEKTAPGKERSITRIAIKRAGTYGHRWILNVQHIDLHCEVCDGSRNFEIDSALQLTPNNITEEFVTFSCRNCQNGVKKYALQVSLAQNGESGTILKFGENPAFVGATATRLLDLLGDQREHFLSGRRCEEQGLGIGAYAYYRRVVESNRNRIYDEIIKVCERQHTDAELVSELKVAKNVQQFSESVSVIKHGMPQSLMIDGENPLTLLHGALSKGVHELSDEECLERATAIRAVLNEMLERIAAALKDDQELLSAVRKLKEARSRA